VASRSRRSRLLRGLLGLVVAAAVAFGLGAIVPRPLVATNDAGPTRQVLLVANAIHTDIAFPADPDVLGRFGFLAEDGLPLDAPDLAWLVIGWGGRAFYLETPTWADLKPLPLARALTLDRAVIHAALGGTIALPMEGVVVLDVDERELNAMIDAALETLVRDAQGRPEMIPGGGYGEYDHFYEAKGWFNVLVGCNLWTSRVLREGGFRTGWWNPLPISLIWSVRTHNALAS
jgi:uncharacterized protein (TIGR02117 family)